jgi:hypothetical protein
VRRATLFAIAMQILLPVLPQAEASSLPNKEAPVQHFVCNIGYTVAKCREDLTTLRNTLAKYPLEQLGNWTWILVRSEDWKAIVTPRGLDPDSPAFTYYAKRETFIEEVLVANVPAREVEILARWHMSSARLRDLAVGHELGHAFCGEKDEAKANRLATLLRQGKPVSCEISSAAMLPFRHKGHDLALATLDGKIVPIR